jgi:HK97 family phage major capsid protein
MKLKIGSLGAAIGVLTLLFLCLSTTGNMWLAGSVTAAVGLFSATKFAQGGFAMTGFVIPDFTEKTVEDQKAMDFNALAEYKRQETEYRIAKAMEPLYVQIKALETKGDKSDELTKLKAEFALLKSEASELNLRYKSMTEAAQKGDGDTLAAELKANMSTIKSIAKRVGTTEDFVIKANVVRTSVDGNTQAQDIPGIGQLATRKLTMYDMFPKIKLGENNNGTVRYWDWDEATIVRAAAMIAETGSFPESTAAFKEYTLDIKKVGDTLPVSAEFFEDESMFAAELSLFLQTNVALEIDDQIANGDNTGQNLKGLFTSIDAFNPALVDDVPFANFYDLIVKCKEQITKTGGAKYMPDSVWMNISSINKLRLSKDANNNYIIPPFVSRDGAIVDGMTVYESNIISDGYMAIGDSRFAKIYEKKGIEVSRGTINAQFTSDMETLKVRKRLGFLIRVADKSGFLKVTDIDAAIAAINLAS